MLYLFHVHRSEQPKQIAQGWSWGTAKSQFYNKTILREVEERDRTVRTLELMHISLTHRSIGHVITFIKGGCV